MRNLCDKRYIVGKRAKKKERARPQYACKQLLTASQAFNISMLSYQSFLCSFYLII